MKISLDFDDTITADVEFWLEFIQLARKHEHEVICVTGREDTPGNREDMDFLDIQKVYCNHEQKSIVCRSRGIEIDVWVDDLPEIICKNCPAYSEALDALDKKLKASLEVNEEIANDLSTARIHAEYARSFEAAKLQKEMGNLRAEMRRLSDEIEELQNETDESGDSDNFCAASIHCMMARVNIQSEEIWWALAVFSACIGISSWICDHWEYEDEHTDS